MTAARTCPEFDCCECGRHIVMVCGVLPEPPLCGLCQHSPGWFTHPEIRALLDPDHPGTEPQLDAVPPWDPTV